MNHFFGESIPLIYRFIKNKSINPLGLLQIGCYLFKHLDEKLYSSDISDTLLPFISDFYEDYMDFCYTVLVDSFELNNFLMLGE